MNPGHPTGLISRWASALTGLTITAVVAAHLRFVIQDVRLPRDLGLYYKSMPDLYHALGGAQPFQTAWDALVTSGGWYNLFLSLVFKVFGRSPAVMQAIDVCWVLAVLLLVAATARHLGGPISGLIAVLLAGSFRILVIEGRIAWIHIPELCMVLLALHAWVRDPDLQRRGTAVRLGTFGVLAMMIRPSGLIWVATLVVPVAMRLRRPEARTRASLLLIAWGVGALMAFRGIAPYLMAKFGARDRYVAALPGIWEQVGGNLGMVAGTVAVLGALACVLQHRRRACWLLAFWIVLTLVMFSVFRAGMNNFPAYGAALAILAGWGLARWHRAGTAAALLAFLIYQLPQWLPSDRPSEAYRWTLKALRVPFQPTPENYYRSHMGVGAPDVIALIDASCAGTIQDCDIMVDQGLFQPYGEDPSAGLERFVARLDHVRVWELTWPWRNLTRARPAALAHFRCGQRELGWRARFPGSLDNLFAAIQGYQLETAREIPWTHDCTLVWMTPGGVLKGPIAPRAPGGEHLVP